MMTPELKQDLDAVMAQLIEEVSMVCAKHGIPQLNVTVSVDDPDCDCSLCGTVPVINTFDDFDAYVSHLMEDLGTELSEAVDAFNDAIQAVMDMAPEMLDRNVMASIVQARGAAAQRDLEASFQA